MRLRFPLSVVRISVISAFHSSSRPIRSMTGRMFAQRLRYLIVMVITRFSTIRRYQPEPD